MSYVDTLINSNYRNPKVQAFLPLQVSKLSSREDCQKLVNHFTSVARYERLTAITLASSTVITSLAIYALSFLACFTGTGFLFGKIYGPYADLTTTASCLVYASIIGMIAGGLLSYYPTKKAVAPLFEGTKFHWECSQSLYRNVEIALQRKAALV